MQKDQLDILLSVLVGSASMLLLVVSTIVLFRIYIKKKNKLLLEKELMRVQFEQTILESKLEIQEETFAYIGQELHDNICQVLSLIRLNLNTLDVPGETKKLTHMDALLEKGLTDLRTLSHSLDAEQIRSTGWAPPAIKLINNLQSTGKYTAEAELEENLPPLGSDRPIILFRMIQEIINNIVKHAQATTILLKAWNENNKLVITIRDNGKGFDIESAAGGAGLRNLEKRSKLIDASLGISSKEGDGTCVTITIDTEKIG